MSIEKEIPFVLFIKSIYEVRPKKNLSPNQTHHWKLRIGSCKSDKDIKKVEFHLHDTFVRPLQIIKKAPFEIEEDGFGNFEMRINVKIFNRNIPLTYFIELFPQKYFNVQYHHSLWMVKPNEFKKVLEIGGIPMKSYDNLNEQSKALDTLTEHVKKQNDRPINPSSYYPKVYQRVMQKIKNMESNESISKTFINNTDIDMGHSDDSSNTRHSQPVKQYRHNKLPTIFDQDMKTKHRNQDPERKKELKRKRNHSESNSESDGDGLHENLFAKHNKKNDNVSSIPKVNEMQMEKLMKVKQEFKQEQSILKMPIKPVVKIENKLQKPLKETKLKLKIKDNNPDCFSKLFDAPDLIVLNKGKVNLANATMNHDNTKKKVEKKEHLISDNALDETKVPKRSHKSDNLQSFKDSRDIMKSTKSLDNNNSKQLMFESKKHKPPEKTMPPEQKKDKKSDQKEKKHSSNFYSKPLSSISSNDSEVAGQSSKSSSDNDIDTEMFRRKVIKKSPIESIKAVGVKQLFGDDDNDISDDDEDQQDEIADLFNVLKNSSGLQPSSNVPVVQHHTQMSSIKNFNNEECGSSSDNETTHKKPSLSSQSPLHKSQEVIKQKLPIKDRNIAVIKSEETYSTSEQMIALKERRKIAKTLLKIKNKKFFAKLQRLLLTSFENSEKSVSFDPNTLRLDFNMGDISDNLVKAIKSLVDEYFKDHNRSLANLPSAH